MTTTIQANINEIQTKPTTNDIGLHNIRIDRTQSRCHLDEETVRKYAKEMHDGVTFDPAIVYHDANADGETYWLADGFHRYAARKQWGAKSLTCEVRIGTERDALLWSLGANAKHGLQRTNDDKRKAVKMALDMGLGDEMSDREIAKLCGVSNWLVSDVQKELRGELLESNSPNPTTTQPQPLAEPVQADDNEPANAQEAEEDENLAADATDVDELKGLTPKTTPSESRPTNAKVPKSGIETVSTKQCKETLSALGALYRGLMKIGLRKQFMDVLAEIELAVKERGGAELKDDDTAGIRASLAKGSETEDVLEEIEAAIKAQEGPVVEDDGTEGFGAWRTDGSETEDIATATPM